MVTCRVQEKKSSQDWYWLKHLGEVFFGFCLVVCFWSGDPKGVVLPSSEALDIDQR